MILSRVIEHVKAQHWTAVVLDFVIVVVGVFVGLQVNNWNESRQQHALKGYYLERLEADLEETLSYMSSQNARSVRYRSIIETFLAALNDPTTDDETLLRSLESYLADGATLLAFNATTATFDDLSSTGNLDLLESPDLVEALVELHTAIVRNADDLSANTNWVQPQESGLSANFDWLRYDPVTSHLFPEKSTAALSMEAWAAEDMLRRHAAIHYWFMETVSADYLDTIGKTERALAMVREELGAAP